VSPHPSASHKRHKIAVSQPAHLAIRFYNVGIASFIFIHSEISEKVLALITHHKFLLFLVSIGDLYPADEPFEIRTFREIERYGMVGSLGHRLEDLTIDPCIQGGSGDDLLE